MNILFLMKTNFYKCSENLNKTLKQYWRDIRNGIGNVEPVKLFFSYTKRVKFNGFFGYLGKYRKKITHALEDVAENIKMNSAL